MKENVDIPDEFPTSTPVLFHYRCGLQSMRAGDVKKALLSDDKKRACVRRVNLQQERPYLLYPVFWIWICRCAMP